VEKSVEMKIAVFTVMYPGMFGFLNEYIKCLQAQTFKDFELVIVNDQFPTQLETYFKKSKIATKIFPFTGLPLENRMYGLKICRDLGYDIVICSDSDETMCPNRIEKIVEYFNNSNKLIVYNNGSARKGDRYFDHYYKNCIRFDDIIDFNILGYGAMSLRSEAVDFILEHENKRVFVFDWWIGTVYLLHFGQVDFLKDVKNNYNQHPDNFVGPILSIEKKRIELGIRVKKSHYSELIEYCHQKNFRDEMNVFSNKLKEIKELEKFIANSSLDYYVELAKDYFKDKKKIYWWQDVLSPAKLGVSNYARN
jgi:glycosyltransferase involved in cell wall biosynthesis